MIPGGRRLCPKFSCLHLFFLLRVGDPCLLDECNKNFSSTEKCKFTFVSKIFLSNKIFLLLQRKIILRDGRRFWPFFPGSSSLVHFKVLIFVLLLWYSFKLCILYLTFSFRKIILFFILLIILFLIFLI